MAYKLRTRWEDIDAEMRAPVEARFGRMPETTLFDVPDNEAVAYGSLDAINTRAIYPILRQQIVENHMEALTKIDHDVIPLSSHMMRKGMKIDQPHFAAFSQDLSKRLTTGLVDIYKACGHDVNPASSDELYDLLFNTLHLSREGRKWTKGRERLQVDDTALQDMKNLHPVVPLLSDWRKLHKLKTTFVDKLPYMVDAKGRIHPSLRITRVPSGRFSAHSPNLQQVPQRTKDGMRVREGFIPEEGFWYISVDLSGIEVRCFANESQDPFLIDCFNRGLDPHTNAASILFGVPYADILADKALQKKYRTPAKSMVFLVLYGGTESGLTDKMIEAGQTSWTDEDSRKFIGEYYNLVKEGLPWIQGVHAFCRRHGYVEDYFGRRVYIAQVYSSVPRIVEEGLRLAQNVMIQAFAAGVMKLAMKNSWDAFHEMWRQGWRADPILPVHDELISEVEDGRQEDVANIVKHCFETAIKLRVPLEASASFGLNWAALK